MASLPTGSPNRTVELLRIDTNWFQLYLQGKPFHPTVETLQLHRRDDESWVEARIQPKFLTSELELHSVSLFDLASQGIREWHPGDACSPLFYETQTYELVIELEEGVELTVAALFQCRKQGGDFSYAMTEVRGYNWRW